MSCVYVADEELDNDDELVLRCRSPRKACSLRFVFCRWEAGNGFAKGPRDLEGDCWRVGTLADAPLSRIYRETVADFGIIPGIFSWLSFNTTYKCKKPRFARGFPY